MDNLAATNMMVRLFAATGFLYLIAATMLLVLDINGVIAVGKAPIFMLALYGFVVQLIFGVSYIFVPGVSHTRYAGYKSAVAEYALLNVGIMAFVSSMMLAGLRGLAAVGAIALILSVLIHALNIWSIVLPKKANRAGDA
ncbi:MAG: hypothetical protein ACYCO0_03630 [Candidatus Micrarchaeaceae archaeon]